MKVERDRNGYALLTINRKHFYITPYMEYYAVRDRHGMIVRNDANLKLVFGSEQAAIDYLKG